MEKYTTTPNNIAHSHPVSNKSRLTFDRPGKNVVQFEPNSLNVDITSGNAATRPPGGRKSGGYLRMKKKR